MKVINNVWCLSSNKTIEKCSLIYAQHTHECVLGQMQKTPVGLLTNPHPKTAFLLNILWETYQAVGDITLENVMGYSLVAITHD